MKSGRLLIIFPLIFVLVKVYGQKQEKYPAFTLEAKGSYGFIIPHRDGVKNLIKGHVPAVEISFNRPTFGNKQWQRLYKYPFWGVSWYYANLSNPQQLGRATGLYPYFCFPLVRGKTVSLNYKIGWGLGYVTHRFEPIENYQNIFIGSRLNAIIHTSANAKIKLSKRLNAHGGLSFTHFSNGAYKMPNLGINIPAIVTGISYDFGHPGEKNKADTIATSIKAKHEVFVGGGGFVREIYPAGGQKYPAANIALNFSRFLSAKSKLIASLDMFYNSSHHQRLPQDIETGSQWSIVQYGLGLFYEIKVSKVAIMTGKGIYIHNPYGLDGLFYHRIGTRYYVNDKLYLNLTLKTHFARADHAEFGLGYRILGR